MPSDTVPNDLNGPPEPKRPKGMVDLRFERPPPGRYRPPPRKSPWMAHFDLCRKEEHLGQWAIVSEHWKGGKRETHRLIYSDRRNIEQWLARNCPLEDWEFRIDTKRDTWCHRQLRIRFMGELTYAEAAKKAAERQRRQDFRTKRTAENRALRAIEARNAALAEQERNRASVRKLR